MTFPSMRGAFLAVSALTLLAGCGDTESKDDPAPVVAVDVARVLRGDVARWIDSYATVTPAPPGAGGGGAAVVTAPDATVVRSLAVHEGQKVGAGTLIARLDDQVAAAQVTQAGADLNAASQRATRQDQLYAIGGVARNTLDEARAQVATSRTGLATARAALARTRLTAPVSGTVARLYVEPGQAVNAGAPIADIVNGNRLSLMAMVPVADAASMAPGQAVEITGEGGAPIAGKLVYVAPAAAPTTGSVMVRASVAGGGRLIQGEAVTLRIRTASHVDTLIVPQAAVYTDHDGKTTLAVVRQGVAHRITVTPGITDGDRVEVTAPGITAGQVVVTTGSYALADGTHVRVNRAGRSDDQP